MSYLRYTIASIVIGVFVYYIAFMKKTRYVTITGTIKNAQQQRIRLEKYSLNNPLSEPAFYQLKLKHQKLFYKKISLDTATVLFLKYKNFNYPVYAEPGQHITISINDAEYPRDVTVHSDHSRRNERYNNYFQYYHYQNTKMSKAVNDAMTHFRKGDASEILKVDNLRIIIAMEDFSGTPFNLFVYRAMSRYFYHDLQHLNNESILSPAEMAKKRHNILEKAGELGYFSERSLASQPRQISRFINELIKTYQMKPYRGVRKNKNLFQNANIQLQVCKVAIRDLLHYIPTPRAKAYFKVQLLAQHYITFKDQLDKKSYTQFVTQYLGDPSDDQFFKKIVNSDDLYPR